MAIRNKFAPATLEEAAAADLRAHDLDRYPTSARRPRRYFTKRLQERALALSQDDQDLLRGHDLAPAPTAKPIHQVIRTVQPPVPGSIAWSLLNGWKR